MECHSTEFKTILKKIRKGEAVDDSRLTPFLFLESKNDRWQINLQLADAYYYSHERRHEEQNLRRAKAYIERAWLLSRYSPEVLPHFIKINRALKDIAALKEALKRAGVEHATRGNYDEALALFDRWLYANAEFTSIDIHSYDPDIIACVERMTALHRFESQKRPQSHRGEKIRLAYLMQGLTQANSVLIKIDQMFAQHHDKSRFEIAYFAIDNESAIAASPDAQAAIRNIGRHGCELFVAPNEGTLYEQLLSVGTQIYSYKPDILITSGALATFKNYLVTCLKPAPVIISFHQGPSPQFSWHTFDHSISWFQTNLPDCPVDCSHVPLEFEWPERASILPVSRADLNIPAIATVMISGGRWPKFQDPNFWRTMIELLREQANLYWIIIGFSEDQIPFAKELLKPNVRSKIRFEGWRSDYLELLTTADLLVDSYPVGGGIFLMEAMSLGIPVLSFRHDYINVFSNNDCSGGDEIVGVPELLIKRGDFDQLKNLISTLVSDKEYRRQLGERCYEWVHQTRAEPARMVRRCEQIYEKVLNDHYETFAVSTGEDTPVLQKSPLRETLEERKIFLIEQAHILLQREAELNRLMTKHNAHFLSRLKRGLYRLRRR